MPLTHTLGSSPSSSSDNDNNNNNNRLKRELRASRVRSVNSAYRFSVHYGRALLCAAGTTRWPQWLCACTTQRTCSLKLSASQRTFQPANECMQYTANTNPTPNRAHAGILWSSQNIISAVFVVGGVELVFGLCWYHGDGSVFSQVCNATTIVGMSNH